VEDLAFAIVELLLEALPDLFDVGTVASTYRTSDAESERRLATFAAITLAQHQATLSHLASRLHEDGSNTQS
jgi:hypothetical protein